MVTVWQRAGDFWSCIGCEMDRLLWVSQFCHGHYFLVTATEDYEMPMIMSHSKHSASKNDKIDETIEKG